MKKRNTFLILAIASSIVGAFTIIYFTLIRKPKTKKIDSSSDSGNTGGGTGTTGSGSGTGTSGSGSDTTTAPSTTTTTSQYNFSKMKKVYASKDITGVTSSGVAYKIFKDKFVGYLEEKPIPYVAKIIMTKQSFLDILNAYKKSLWSADAKLDNYIDHVKSVYSNTVFTKAFSSNYYAL